MVTRRLLDDIARTNTMSLFSNHFWFHFQFKHLIVPVMEGGLPVEDVIKLFAVEKHN